MSTNNLSTRELAKRRRAAVEHALSDALTKDEARTRGLSSVTQGYFMRRWDFASRAIDMLADYRKQAPQRDACFVKITPMLVEIWAKPAMPIPAKKA